MAQNRTNIQVYTGNGTNSQKFKFEAVSGSGNNNNDQEDAKVKEGTYTIKSALNTKYVLDVAAASKANGANIQLFEYDNVDQQRFKIKPLGGGYYSITALHSGKSLDVAGRRK